MGEREGWLEVNGCLMVLNGGRGRFGKIKKNKNGDLWGFEFLRIRVESGRWGYLFRVGRVNPG